LANAGFVIESVRKEDFEWIKPEIQKYYEEKAIMVREFIYSMDQHQVRPNKALSVI
jgi:hypothetical protein